MAATWSKKKALPEPISRVISALSLDGHRIATEIVVTFRRPLTPENANSVADEAAKAAAHILGNQICQGELPLSKAELGEQIGERTSVTLSKYAELQVSTLAFVGAHAPSRSTTRSRADIRSPPKFETSSPAQASISGMHPAVSPPRTGGAVAHTPSVSTDIRDPSARVPAETQKAEYLQPRTLWRQALANRTGEHKAEELGMLLAPALRDSTATALFLTLLAVDPTRVERLPLSGGAGAQQQLLREISACFGAAVYRVLSAEAVEKSQARQIAEQAVGNALGSDQPSSEAMGVYLISQAPVSDLARRLAQALGSPADARRILQALAAYCQTLRAELSEVARHVRHLIV